MRKIEQFIITKGHYEHSQIKGLVSVKQYIFARVKGKKCLILRFCNETDFKVNAINFVVLQLNAAGEIIDRTPVQYKDIVLLPGGVMSMNDGIVVSEKCADFKVQLISVQSGQYEYRVKDGDTVAVYYNAKERWKRLENAASHADGLNAVSKRPGNFGFFAFVATMSVLAICALMFWPYIKDIIGEVF
ncbi:MAG: hypothetical protein E7667_01690 [Ruminococcaceae bacterium]|nr:hypothetical protein [Oscillospiraceae bacterium]